MRYFLSLAADKDLSDIFDYTEEKFGIQKAVDYVSGFNGAFQMICDNPVIGRDRAEIREGLRSFVKDQHIVFYRILEEEIRIIRILSSFRDVTKFNENPHNF